MQKEMQDQALTQRVLHSLAKSSGRGSKDEDKGTDSSGTEEEEQKRLGN